MSSLNRKLPERRERIIRAILHFYMRYALPVGSQRLREEYDLPWSSATIRSEMAWMENQGYLKHTHTSSGRLPTSLGLRYYVDHLLEQEDMSGGMQQRIEEELEAVSPDLLGLLRCSSKLLSRYSRHVSLTQVNNGGTKNYVIMGQENFLGQPEFGDTLKLKDLFHVLEEEEVRDYIVKYSVNSKPVRIFIGGEDLTSTYRDLFDEVSVVAAPYGRDGRTMGAVSVIGPRRMDYCRMIPLVNFTARSMERALSQSH